MDLLLNNAQIIDAHTNIFGSLWLRDGKIYKVIPKNSQDTKIENPHGVRKIDINALALMPSFIDVHCHLREPGQTAKEDLFTGQKAALKGGFTHIASMANTSPPIDSVEIIKEILEKSKAYDLCEHFQMASITKGMKGKELVDFDELLPYTNIFSDDGKNIDDLNIMKSALSKSQKKGFLIVTHSEPEPEIIQRDLELLKSFPKARLHIAHVSEKKSIDIIRKYREQGLNFTFEVAPHHIFDYDNPYKVHPPFGNKDDYESLLEAIGNGLVDCIGTDHAPHTKEDKSNGSPGLIGFENAFEIVNKTFTEHSLSINKLSELMSLNPAKILNLDSGIIEEGKEANLVVVDLNKSSKIDIKTIISKSKNTPFEKRETLGQVIMTIRKGEIKYDKDAR